MGIVCLHCTVQIAACQRADLHLETGVGGSLQDCFGVPGGPQYIYPIAFTLGGEHIGGKISVRHTVFQVVVVHDVDTKAGRDVCGWQALLPM